VKRFALNAWNDWRWVERSRVDVTLLRCNFDYMRGLFVSVDVVLLGFGFSLSWYVNGLEPTGTWGDLAGAALNTYAWEPIETNGWAGEPQGREHAP
jgi:hypothetical protein